jgi:hypothetical protein
MSLFTSTLRLGRTELPNPKLWMLISDNPGFLLQILRKYGDFRSCNAARNLSRSRFKLYQLFTKRES